MMIDLDNKTLVLQIDKSQLIDKIGELGEECGRTWSQAQKLKLPEDYKTVDAVVVLGMGGSAIGADLVRSLVWRELPKPMAVIRDYDLPGFVNARTLVIASSYSGTTEETLTAFEQALARGARCLAITTGGRLAERARQAGVAVLPIDYVAPPRAALAHSLIPILAILQKLGLVVDKRDQVAEAVSILSQLRTELGLDRKTDVNLAKQLAIALYGRLPVVYGAGFLDEVARRWKTQINENSKAWSYWEVFPELNHNAVVGFEFPEELRERIMVVMLDSESHHPRVRARLEITGQILARRGVDYRVMSARGKSPLAQVLSTVSLGDYTSYYLAILYGRDPSPVEIIDYLKGELAKK